ncbi:hypothetical protein CONPUDRAFT_140527 [Coniophora puteana RWD-64-598 SS2]|uniref:Uncharacterized protein n=1 Tax=Coniophora puteana (strain RWD-64-598) TaxID=741705 RepID=R7SH66_CONPW|nr:uncharacterized protein CONPUDRAFT_140527 [Coniophora puteana RWD-64-598 SS2]EIW74409.1 hypothetical protein CONPUDRAFT_140527 [Coniophora puteana RWD-64-598 SS2]
MERYFMVFHVSVEHGGTVTVGLFEALASSTKEEQPLVAASCVPHGCRSKHLPTSVARTLDSVLGLLQETRLRMTVLQADVTSTGSI